MSLPFEQESAYGSQPGCYRLDDIGLESSRGLETLLNEILVGSSQSIASESSRHVVVQ